MGPKPVSRYQDHQAQQTTTEMVRVVNWQFHYHLNFLLAELCSKLVSQVEENILFPILFFQKATQKRPRAKGSNDLRMRYEDYCECSKLFTIWSAFPRLQSWRKTRICKTKCSQSCCRNWCLFFLRGASQEQQSFMQNCMLSFGTYSWLKSSARRSKASWLTGYLSL